MVDLKDEKQPATRRAKNNTRSSEGKELGVQGQKAVLTAAAGAGRGAAV